MADIRARLLAILREPDRFTGKHTTPFLPGGSKYFVVDTQTGTETEVSHSYKIAEMCADQNARHRIKRLCEEIAKVAQGWTCEAAGDFYRTDGGTHYWDEDSIYGTARSDAGAKIRALGEDNEHSYGWGRIADHKKENGSE